MALSAARRLSSSSAAAAPASKLSPFFAPRQKEKPLPPPPGSRDELPAPKLSSLFALRQKPKPRPPATDSRDEPQPRKPRPKLRRLWEEEAAALLRRLHDGRYLPGPDFSSVPYVCSPDFVKAAAERFGHDHQVVANCWNGKSGANPSTLGVLSSEGEATCSILG